MSSNTVNIFKKLIWSQYNPGILVKFCRYKLQESYRQHPHIYSYSWRTNLNPDAWDTGIFFPFTLLVSKLYMYSWFVGRYFLSWQPPWDSLQRERIGLSFLGTENADFLHLSFHFQCWLCQGTLWSYSFPWDNVTPSLYWQKEVGASLPFASLLQ